MRTGRRPYLQTIAAAAMALSVGLGQAGNASADPAATASPASSPTIAPTTSPTTAPSTTPVSTPDPTPDPNPIPTSTSPPPPNLTPTPAPPPAQPTAIELNLPGPTPAGAAATMTARLTSNGVGLDSARLHYQLDGGDPVWVTTDTDGTVTAELSRNLGIGSHTARFAFAGDRARNFQPSAAQGSLVVIPPSGTSIGLRIPAGQRTGQAISVEATVFDNGRPLSGALLHVAAAGHHVALVSNGSGQVSYRLPRTLAAGTYPVTVRYHGDRSRGILGTEASGSLIVLPPLRTSVSVTLPPPTKAGQEADITAQLVSETGPLPARTPLHLRIDGRARPVLETDAGGWVHLKLPRQLKTGGHSVTLAYHGDRSRGIAGSSSSGSLQVTPLEVRLQTVPALAGVTFTVDGQQYVTGPSGLLGIGVNGAGDHRISVRPPADRPDAHVRFSRWFDEDPSPERTLRIFADETVHAGFSGSFLTPVSFQDAAGRWLDVSRLGPVQVSGPSGRRIEVQPGQTALWLDVPAPSRAALVGLEPVPRYTVESAQFDGVSVANHGDDAFTPGQSRQWNVRLRIYTLRLKARQPVLGRGVGMLAVTSPAGSRRLLHPDAGGVVVLRDLPRGLYSVSSAGGWILPTTLVRMTRDQAVYLSNFTPEEMAAGLLVLLVILAGLGVAGLALRWPPGWAAGRRRWR